MFPLLLKFIFFPFLIFFWVFHTPTVRISHHVFSLVLYCFHLILPCRFLSQKAYMGSDSYYTLILGRKYNNRTCKHNNSIDYISNIRRNICKLFAFHSNKFSFGRFSFILFSLFLLPNSKLIFIIFISFYPAGVSQKKPSVSFSLSQTSFSTTNSQLGQLEVNHFYFILFYYSRKNQSLRPPSLEPIYSRWLS